MPMKTSPYWLEGPWPGRLAILPRPRGGDWLEGEVRSWKAEGIDSIVSLLEPDEEIGFDLHNEEAFCTAHGIRFGRLPIPDRGVPQSKQGTADLIRRLEADLQQGKDVGVHCRQGIGRSAM